MRTVLPQTDDRGRYELLPESWFGILPTVYHRGQTLHPVRRLFKPKFSTAQIIEISRTRHYGVVREKEEVRDKRKVTKKRKVTSTSMDYIEGIVCYL